MEDASIRVEEIEHEGRSFTVEMVRYDKDDYSVELWEHRPDDDSVCHGGADFLTEEQANDFFPIVVDDYTDFIDPDLFNEPVE